MPLDADAVSVIEALLTETSEPGDFVLRLKQRFPKLSVTRCDPSDVETETPFLSKPRLRLYLVDGLDHCWRLTTDAARATGVVVVRT
jgi:hypothetical protein